MNLPLLLRPAPVRHLWGWALVLFCLFSLTGCTNLAAVRDFAKTSAATADYQQVPADFASSGKRWLIYQYPEPSATTLPQDRENERRRFEQAQMVVVNYMNALGALATDKLPKTDADITALLDALKKNEFIGEADKMANVKTLTAAGMVAGSLTNILQDARRQRALRQLIEANDSSLQVVIAGMVRIVRLDFVESLVDEEDLAKSFFRKMEDGASDKAMVRYLTRFPRLDQKTATRARKAHAQAYAKVLEAIGKGHAALRQNADHLQGPALQASLQGYAEELQKLYKTIRDLG